MELHLKCVGIVGSDTRQHTYQRQRAHALMLQAGRQELHRRAAEKAVLSPRVYPRLDAAYRSAAAHLEAELAQVYQDHAALEAEELRATQAHLLRVERAALQDVQRHGLVDIDTAHELGAARDVPLLALQEGAAASTDDPLVPGTTPQLPMQPEAGSQATQHSGVREEHGYSEP